MTMVEAECVARDYRGRFLPKLRETQPGSCEWLIWSKYHHCWHRRSLDGGACGYTREIAQAGIFPIEKARQYNDDRNRPYHVSEKAKDIAATIAEHEAIIARLSLVRDFLRGQR